ncbi:thioesterase II family protein [Streptomyces lonarensis]|uniref:Thioesterase n=1 Tax=Streptomyces lonarensis TaxID=700599 RepID=A0A7X6CZN8_9ACTN|nr:alpha/beta fold hydrolase [Streptomyces lonarensis]NJQ05526.1 thioesterase [Streptomyces lonarensis]
MVRETSRASWLRRPAVRPEAERRLVCFPHAGGAASSFRPWQRLLPDGIEYATVQYPGREDRVLDPAVESMAELVDAVVDVLLPLLDRPLALFGHSMGSAVAYEVALELRRRGLPEPVRLLVAGRAAPHAAAVGAIHRADDEVLLAELTRYGVTPREVLADPELRAGILRYVRADYRVIETYLPSVEPPLSCPVSVYHGTADPECGVEQAETWAAVTRRPLALDSFEGGHFFLVPQRVRLAEAVARDLGVRSVAAARTWPSTP